MIYGSVCSGIEAVTQAVHPLGWSPAFFSEIEEFPNRVLAHHYGSNMPDEPYATNGVPNYGDMTRFEEWPDHGPRSARPIDALFGGTPCQSYSVAGLRKGLDDPRGNLMLTYAAILRQFRPRWMVWENVSGVLSSDRGRDFASLLGLLTGKRVTVPRDGWRNAGYVTHGTHGYGVAWRVLDTQYCRVDGFGRAIPQRRRRVFVVGYLGDWRRAAAVLFERESLRRDPPPSRKAGQGFAADAEASAGIGSHWDGSGVHPSLSQALGSSGGIGASNQEIFSQRGAGLVRTFDRQSSGEYGDQPIASTVSAKDYKGATDLIAFNSREDPEVTGDRSGPLGASSPQAQAIAFMAGQGAKAGSVAASSEISPTLRSSDSGTNQVPSVAFAQNTRDEVRLIGGDGQTVGALAAEPGMKQQSFLAQHPSIGWSEELTPSVEVAGTIQHGGAGGRHDGVFTNWEVRRLTPKEAERLQGMADNYTRIPWRGKDASDCPDGHRYKALGNSMSVNVMRWIAMRMEMVDAIKSDTES